MALTLSTRLPRSRCCMRILPQRVPLADLQHNTKPNKITSRLQSHCTHNQVPLNASFKRRPLYPGAVEPNPLLAAQVRRVLGSSSNTSVSSELEISMKRNEYERKRSGNQELTRRAQTEGAEKSAARAKQAIAATRIR
jgi:hypothetical protein